MDSAGDLDAAIEMLSVHGWFAERPPDLRAALADMARLRDYAAGEALYHYGDAPNGIFGLVRGALDGRDGASDLGRDLGRDPGPDVGHRAA